MPRFAVRQRVSPSDERLKRPTTSPSAPREPDRNRDSGPSSYIQDVQRRAGNSATLQLLSSGGSHGTGTVQRTPSSVKDKIDFFEKGGSTGTSGGSGTPVISDRVSDFKSLLSKFKGSDDGTNKEGPPPTSQIDRPPANEEKEPRTPGGVSYGGSSYTSGGVSYTTGSEFFEDGGYGYKFMDGGYGYKSEEDKDAFESGGYVPNNLEDDKDGALTAGGVGYGSKTKDRVKYGTGIDAFDDEVDDEFDDDLDDDLSDDEEDEPVLTAKEPEYDSFEHGRKHGRTLSKFKDYEGEEQSSIKNLQESIDDLKKTQAKREAKGETLSLGQLAIEQLGWSQSDVDSYLSEKGELKLPKVKYLTEPTERSSYELTDGNPFFQGDDEKAFTTEGMFSKHSGKDWGIYVMDPDGKIYAGQHRVGLFHHSTFMAGANVAGAGELKVSKDGKLEHITNKTGHYRGDADHLWQAVDEFKDRGIALGSFKVSTFNGTIKDQPAETFYRSHTLKQLKLKEEPKPVQNLDEDDDLDDDDDDEAGYHSELDDAVSYKTSTVSDETDDIEGGSYVPNDLEDDKDTGTGGYVPNDLEEDVDKGVGYSRSELTEDKDDDNDDFDEDDDLVSTGGYTTNYTTRDEDD